MPPMDWEEYVSEIASDIMKEQSPKRLGTIFFFFFYWKWHKDLLIDKNKELYASYFI